MDSSLFHDMTPEARKVEFWKVPEFRRAFWEGENAWEDGKFRKDNPFHGSDPRWIAWSDGYTKAQLDDDARYQAMEDSR